MHLAELGEMYFACMELSSSLINYTVGTRFVTVRRALSACGKNKIKDFNTKS